MQSRHPFDCVPGLAGLPYMFGLKYDPSMSQSLFETFAREYAQTAPDIPLSRLIAIYDDEIAGTQAIRSLPPKEGSSREARRDWALERLDLLDILRGVARPSTSPKIHAIKKLRELTMWHLGTAKETVEDVISALDQGWLSLEEKKVLLEEEQEAIRSIIGGP